MTDPADITRAQHILEDALNVEAPDPDVDLIAAGLIDSLGLVTLIFELEQEFKVHIPLESLDADDFRSIANIARTIEKLLKKAVVE